MGWMHLDSLHMDGHRFSSGDGVPFPSRDEMNSIGMAGISFSSRTG
jgi:hypothetical protein